MPNEKMEKYFKTKKEKDREKTKRYRLKHPDRVKASKKKYLNSHPEKVKKWKRTDYLKHKNAYLERARKSYLANKEKCNKRTLLWKKENHYWQIQDAKRRSLIKKLGGSFTLKEWEEKKKQYGFKCAICQRDEEELIKNTGIGLTVDHIIPLSKWEKYIKQHPLPYKCGDIENIQPLCINCNSQKQAKIVISKTS